MIQSPLRAAATASAILRNSVPAGQSVVFAEQTSSARPSVSSALAGAAATSASSAAPTAPASRVFIGWSSLCGSS